MFDESFSLELEHYGKELDFLVQTLQLTIDINRNFNNDRNYLSQVSIVNQNLGNFPQGKAPIDERLEDHL